MLPPRCITCNKILSHLEIPYDEGLTKIELDNNLTDEEKNKLKRKLIDDSGLTRYCCRRLLMSYVKKIVLIK